MLKTYKYRIYPTNNQIIKIDQTINVCRFIYNLALETKIRAWQSAQKSISAYDLQKQLPELKKEYPWIAEVHSQALTGCILNLDKAFRSFFKGHGFPKFKNKKQSQSFPCPCGKREVNFNKSTLTIPKINDIPIVFSRQFDGKIKTVTIIKTKTNKYFASILVDNGQTLPIKPATLSDKVVGIDIGIKSFVVTSNGLFYEPNQKLKENLQRLKCLQNRASRKKKGSKNKIKANLSVAKIHERVLNQRADYIHKITTYLFCDNQVYTFVI